MSNHASLCKSYLDDLAGALAESQQLQKATILRQLIQCELQRSTARKIRFLRGKLTRNSTTMVIVETEDGDLKDSTEKRDMERAIMQNNESKFKQSLHTPFFQQPLTSVIP